MVHEAFIVNDSTRQPQYFVKVINNSPNTVFTITHVWMQDGAEEKDILNHQTPLPHKLEKTDVWETWFPKAMIVDQQNIFNNVHVILSNGRDVRSIRNTTVRPVGFIGR